MAIVGRKVLINHRVNNLYPRRLKARASSSRIGPNGADSITG